MYMICNGSKVIPEFLKGHLPNIEELLANKARNLI